MLDALFDNQMFAAGAGVVGLGAGVAAARQGLKQLAYFARRHYLTTLEIPSHDKATFYAHRAWLNQRRRRIFGCCSGLRSRRPSARST
jgi:chaperone BCS1